MKKRLFLIIVLAILAAVAGYSGFAISAGSLNDGKPTATDDQMAGAIDIEADPLSTDASAEAGQQ